AYNLFINQVVEANDSISVRNFCCPIRKLRGIDLSDVEINYNNIFGSFRSKIESTFGELGTIFERFSNKSIIHISDIEVFNLQFKLACLLLNIKKFVTLGNIPVQPHHSFWIQDKFEYYQDSQNETGFDKVDTIKTKISHGEDLLRLQESF